ncbi:hypothetical protein RHMOL_Rhmol13G0124600 [Rhododendron molle]|uniref:Uncharacterized protein n=2 Tax=Rhododendron molle TaxID=49168 RepID=A0ACC0L6Y2_RHOML|nr:hypothetical protein RHMOL_Rhmol13G0124600 [Rhododendron molle]KAI8524117.1 hypothetical protein RHMOL_Rhmol13G0124600 [Rhododendron molle]
MARLRYGLAPTDCSKMEHFSLCPILVPLQVYYPSFDLRTFVFFHDMMIIGVFHDMTVLKRYACAKDIGVFSRYDATEEICAKNTLECGQSCNAEAAAVVGEVLAMRLKVEGLEQGQGRWIHMDLNKEVEKKVFKNRTKVSANANALKSNRVKLILDEDETGLGGSAAAPPPPSSPLLSIPFVLFLRSLVLGGGVVAIGKELFLMLALAAFWESLLVFSSGFSKSEVLEGRR